MTGGACVAVTVTGHADVASSGLELSVTFSTSSPGVALWKWSISVGELTVAADTASVRVFCGLPVLASVTLHMH